MMKSGDRPGLLGLNDLRAPGREGAVATGLTVLNRIKSIAIAAPEEENQRSIVPVQYISSQLHVYMTLTNMRGISYSIGFGRPGNQYGMITHGDRAHYIVEGLGRTHTQNTSWLEEDARSAAEQVIGVQLAAGGAWTNRWRVGRLRVSGTGVGGISDRAGASAPQLYRESLPSTQAADRFAAGRIH